MVGTSAVNVSSSVVVLDMLAMEINKAPVGRLDGNFLVVKGDRDIDSHGGCGMSLERRVLKKRN